MIVDPSVNRLAAAGVAYAPEIAGAARRHGLDPCLLAAVAAQETGGPAANAGRNVVGDDGHGKGLFQIDDRWHAFARSSQAMDPAANAEYAAGMLRGLLDRYGNVHEALSAYNAGSPDATGTKTDWGGARLGYADSVMRHYGQISGTPAPGVPQDMPPAPGLESRQPAGAFPMMPQLQQLPQTPQTYQRQTTDYSGLFDFDDSEA